MEEETDIDRWGAGLQAISAQLAGQGYVAILWHIDDVKQERPDLTDGQAMAVLRKAERDHTADIGINWDVLRGHADELYGPGDGPDDDEPPPEFWAERDAAFAAWDEARYEEDGRTEEGWLNGRADVADAPLPQSDSPDVG